MNSLQAISNGSGSLKFEYLIVGKGLPNIIFLNGYRMDLKSWDKIYTSIATQYSVFLFNRLGVGKSSKPNEPQNGLTVVQNIRELLSSLQIEPPYIFVAHSIGGLLAELYVRTYPEEVAGVVFVDSPHPDEVVEMKKFKLPIVLKGLNFVLNTMDKVLNRYVHSEDENIENTVNEIKKAGVFPEVPITVISGQKKMLFVPVAAYNLHQKYQRKMLELSPYSSHVKCHKSGHFPQISESSVVISSISEMLLKLNSANQLSQQDVQKARAST